MAGKGTMMALGPGPHKEKVAWASYGHEVPPKVAFWAKAMDEAIARKIAREEAILFDGVDPLEYHEVEYEDVTHERKALPPADGAGEEGSPEPQGQDPAGERGWAGHLLDG